MSHIVPLKECVARPPNHIQRFYLIDHLEGVRKNTHSIFLNNNLNKIEFELLQLATICHDLGKANVEWQQYVIGNLRKGPNHSGCGAILFAYLAYHYLQSYKKWGKYRRLWLQFTRDIADHHGELKSIIKNEEIESGSFEKMDMVGIQKWVYEQFPIFEEREVSISASTLLDWYAYDYLEFVEDALIELHSENRQQTYSISNMMDTLQKWRFFTSVFISSDRFEIEPVQDKRLTKSDWQLIKKEVNHYCKQGNLQSLSKLRSQAQATILEKWKKNKNRVYYVLEMPTGYGKTVTALKIATEIGKKNGHSKIIYVAPYLSILEQNSEAIEKATGRRPLQHHSMAILNNKTLDENSETDAHSTLHMQAWAHHIVCTSFVQWMRAIFPRRAQETLRRSYLEDAVIIIDEPQIIDASVWNLFLVGLNSLANRYNLTVIFCSATMPPFNERLGEQPVRLTVTSRKSDDRYFIQTIDSQTKETCARHLMEIKEPTAIGIFNTIQDAIDVFDGLPNCETTNTYLLHGLMAPIHKAIQIKQIRQNLQKQKNKKIRVVSTQIIEAGVDLSFHYMYRALPIIPSLIQAAGRVNRHRELPMGRIETSLFLREERDTRYVYSTSLRRISDELLFQKEKWYEHEMNSLMRIFYEKMFTENSYEAVLQDIQSAFLGNWPSVSCHDVFQSDDQHLLPLFVPFEWENQLKWLPNTILSLLNEFDIKDSKRIYKLFLEKNTRLNWSFEKNKRFSVLFQQFVINVPVEKALRLVSKEDFLQYRVPIIEDSYSYDNEKGLHISEEVSSVII